MGAGTLHTPVRAVRQVQGTRETAGPCSSSLCALGYLEVTAPSHCWREVPGSSLSHVLMLILSLSHSLSSSLLRYNSPTMQFTCSTCPVLWLWCIHRYVGPSPESPCTHLVTSEREPVPYSSGFPSASPSPALNNISLSLYIDFLFPCWTFIKMAVDIRWSLSTSFFP